MDASDKDEAGCSDEFHLMASEDAPAVGDVDGPYLIVTAPAKGDFAEAGKEYTVEVTATALTGDRPWDFPSPIVCVHGAAKLGGV